MLRLTNPRPIHDTCDILAQVAKQHAIGSFA